MTVDPSVEAAVHLSELALDVAEQTHPAGMMDRVAELAAKLIDCAVADIIRVNRLGQLRIITSSDPEVSGRTERAWRRWPHLPQTADVQTDHIAMVLQRSSYMQQLRAGAGIVQELIVPLRAASTEHGYLRFLFTEPRAAAVDRALISAFCAHAALALDRAVLLTQVESLHNALDSNRQIGAAVGVLMANGNLTYAQAVDRLKTRSRNSNRKLRDIAAEVLSTGQPAVDS
jgi:GAF domain-containing protein